MVEKLQQLSKRIESVGTRAQKLSEEISKCKEKEEVSQYKHLIGQLAEVAMEAKMAQNRLQAIMKENEGKMNIQELDEEDGGGDSEGGSEGGSED